MFEVSASKIIMLLRRRKSRMNKEWIQIYVSERQQNKTIKYHPNDQVLASLGETKKKLKRATQLNNYKTFVTGKEEKCIHF